MSEMEKIKIDPAKLRTARGDRKLSDVARTVGISKQNLSNYEKGHNQPSAVILARLCILYETRIENLVTAGEVFLQNEYSAA
jgi:transcriptional regulator with XRE-family HTH domain